jgi:hypothetical protein
MASNSFFCDSSFSAGEVIYIPEYTRTSLSRINGFSEATDLLIMCLKMSFGLSELRSPWLLPNWYHVQ